MTAVLAEATPCMYAYVWVGDVIAAHPPVMERFRGGEVKLIGIFVRQGE